MVKRGYCYRCSAFIRCRLLPNTYKCTGNVIRLEMDWKFSNAPRTNVQTNVRTNVQTNVRTNVRTFVLGDGAGGASWNARFLEKAKTKQMQHCNPRRNKKNCQAKQRNFENRLFRKGICLLPKVRITERSLSRSWKTNMQRCKSRRAVHGMHRGFILLLLGHRL